MSSTVEVEYSVSFREFQTNLHKEELTACNKLDDLRDLQVSLRQLRATYWMRPCLKNWPCVFDQHHSNIDDLQERVAVIELSLLRQCEAEMYAKRVRQSVDAMKAEAEARVESVNINKNNVTELHMHIPELSFSIKHV